MAELNRMMRALRKLLVNRLRPDTETQLAVLKSHYSRVARSAAYASIMMEYRREAELREVLTTIESTIEKLRNQSSKSVGSLTEAPHKTELHMPPQLGERILLLILTKEERVNIPGDLEEEYRGIAAKHGARYAKLWYYKQVAASAWPMVRKAAGWGLLASIGAWIRRII